MIDPKSQESKIDLTEKRQKENCERLEWEHNRFDPTANLQRQGAIRRAGRTGSLDSGQPPSTEPRETPKRGQTFPLPSGDVRLLPPMPREVRPLPSISDTQGQPAAKRTPLDITSTDKPETEGNYQDKDQIIAQKAKILQSQISKI